MSSQRKNTIWVVAVAALVLGSGAFWLGAQNPKTQGGISALTLSTDTPVPTATVAPTSTFTPVSTPRPMLSVLGAQTVRCGVPGATVLAGGDCFQAHDGGGLTIYDALGNVVFHVDGTNGNVTASGSISGASLGGTTTSATITDLTTTRITGTLQTAAQTNVTSLGTQTHLTVTVPISMAGDTFTGAVKFGSAALITDGATITHSITTVPTACVLTPGGSFTATIKTLTAVTMTVNISGTAGTIYWMCGK